MFKIGYWSRIVFLLLFVVIGSFSRGTAQSFGDSVQVSLLTCGEGDELYATFGHSAIRVKDYSTGADYVFNYGTFDFSAPHFYWKFLRGRLLYFLSVQRFPVFIQEYKVENRKVTQQTLNLSTEGKEAVFSYLKNNYLPQNRYYKYDFLFDNCSTRIRDIFEDLYGKNWQIKNIIPQKNLSFRQIINSYLQDKPWEKLGINLMFGKRADEDMNNAEIMFLPYFLMKGIGHSTVSGKPLIKETRVLYEPVPEADTGTPFYDLPLFWFSLLAVFVLLLSFIGPTRFTCHLLPWIDRCLFFLTGVLGCFLLFMWFGTDHQITVWNYNVLWLFPLNLVFSFFFFKNKKWVRGYALFLLALNIILLAGWGFLPQQFPYAALPFMVMIAVRSWKIAFPKPVTLRPSRFQK